MNKMETENIDNLNRTKSLRDIYIYKAQNYSSFTDDERKKLALDELDLVGKEIETKITVSQCKANTFKLIGGSISIIILLCSAFTMGLEAFNDCMNISVIVLAGIIFVLEGTGKLFKWGPQGVLYKQGTIKLKKIAREVQKCMYEFHTYSLEQILSIINQLRSKYDDIDIGLYKMSINYTDEFDIEQGMEYNNNSPTASPNNNTASPHVHIHIDNTTPLPNISLPNELLNIEKMKHDNMTPLPNISLPNELLNVEKIKQDYNSNNHPIIPIITNESEDSSNNPIIKSLNTND